MMKPTQEQAVAWAKEVSGVEFPAGTAGVKIGMSPEHLESVAALAYEAGRKDERERILDMCKEGLWDGGGIKFHLERMNKEAEKNGEEL